ncbi:hypothetical protein NESM_000665200 [Novymonas esmeraldas]|uniref:Uncharacterized protein n=1 Tax=Novymonas esmeraldas TaxID=1808958 RepID=A0AAW0ET26_9TRYP
MFTSAAAATRRSAQATATATEARVVRDALSSFEQSFPAAAIPANPRDRRHSGTLSDSSVNVLATRGTPAAQTRPHPSVTAKHATAAAKSTRARVDRLTAPPFCGSPVHGERSALAEAQQVQEAVTWLRACPTRTLQVLQQRVLCATETLFTQLVGMPLAARRVLEATAAAAPPAADAATAGAAKRSAADDDANGVQYVSQPQPISFPDLVRTFLRDSTAGDAASPSTLDSVLSSGRPRPTAPLTSLHLVYGPHVMEEVLRRSGTSPAHSAASAAAPPTGLEDHQALLSEIVHWSTFFESVFDRAREGLCRDPVNLYAAVLLACAERGAWERRNTADALADDAVRQLRLDDTATGRRPDVCVACSTETAQLAAQCRGTVKRTLRAAAASPHASKRHGATSTSATHRGGGGGGARPVARLFLATPAVVWWAAAFLRLYRLRTPAAAPHRAPRAEAARRSSSSTTLTDDAAVDGAAGAVDVVSSAEAYLIRDWIAQAAKLDRDGFSDQEDAGSLRVAFSCATHAPVAVFGFTHANVQAALQRMGAWVDASVEANTPLSVGELLTALQDDYAVLPYYLSYFSGA